MKNNKKRKELNCLILRDKLEENNIMSRELCNTLSKRFECYKYDYVSTIIYDMEKFIGTGIVKFMDYESPMERYHLLFALLDNYKLLDYMIIENEYDKLLYDMFKLLPTGFMRCSEDDKWYLCADWYMIYYHTTAISDELFAMGYIYLYKAVEYGKEKGL